MAASILNSGKYIPPFKRAQLEAEQAKEQQEAAALSAGAGNANANNEEDDESMYDPESRAFQREYWDALRRSITGAVNKASPANIEIIAVEILRENVVRGRGLLCKALMGAQKFNPKFTDVYAALTAIVNSKMPSVGELLMKRLIAQYKRLYRRRDRDGLLVIVQFLAALVVHRVQDELLLLKLLASLLCSGDTPTPGDVEVAACAFNASYKFLELNAPQAFRFVLEPMRAVLHSGKLDLRSECVLEGLLKSVREWQTQKTATGATIIDAALDVVAEEDRKTHNLELDDDFDIEGAADVFSFDAKFEENEAAYDELKIEMLGADNVDVDFPDAGNTNGAAGDGDDGEGAADTAEPEDQFATLASALNPLQAAVNAAQQASTAGLEGDDLMLARREIFLVFQSSVRAEEIAHKLLKNGGLGKEGIVTSMVLEAACQNKSYDRMFGMLADVLCHAIGRYQSYFELFFADRFARVDEFEVREIDIIARLFAHTLRQGGIRWTVLRYVKLNAAETTAASRRFLQTLFQEIGSTMGVTALAQAINSPEVARDLSGLFPKDSLDAARYAVNFFEIISETGVDLRPVVAPLRQWVVSVSRQQGAYEFGGMKRDRADDL